MPDRTYKMTINIGGDKRDAKPSESLLDQTVRNLVDEVDTDKVTITTDAEIEITVWKDRDDA